MSKPTHLEVIIHCHPETQFIEKLVYSGGEIIIDTTQDQVLTRVLPNGKLDTSLYSEPIKDILNRLIDKYYSDTIDNGE